MGVAPKEDCMIKTIPNAKKYNPNIKTAYFFTNSSIFMRNLHP